MPVPITTSVGRESSELVRPLIMEIGHLCYHVGGQRILDDLSLTLHSQEIHALLGANGAGKSTLASVLLGCEGYRPTSGSVLFEGEDLLALPMHERAKRGLTMAWQEPARFEGITVRQYLALGRTTVDPAPALLAVGLAPDRYLDRNVDKAISGGERHRIELAAVLALRPKLAIPDEPAAGIDMLSIRHIIEAIQRIKAGGGSVLLITHQEEVALMADSASQLCGGRIVCTGTPSQVVEHFRGRSCVRCDGSECGYE